MNVSYNWLKSYIPDIPEPKHLEDIFTYHICEVESVEKLVDGDYLFDLGILPNRAHDLLSHQGVAKELSSLLGIPFKDPTSFYKTPASIPTKLKVEIQNDNCRRYSARIIRNIKVGPSPEWVVKHLESIGQRSINNIVDATNIVMYDCGQPTHAFDLRKIKGDNIVIKNGEDGIEFPVVGRDGIIAKLKSTDLVITDGEHNLALGGVKGGLDSGISDDTTDIVIEVANFNPTAVRKTARRLGLLSDSAKRFENDLSTTLCDFGMFSLSALLIELFPEAIFEDIVDVYPNSQKEITVSFNTKKIENLLGIQIPVSEIENILKNYSFVYTKKDDEYIATVPPLRLDITGAHDMAEEIGRVIGYDKLKPILPKTTFVPKVNETYEKISSVRNYLTDAGYREVMTYGFTDNGDIEVLASASDKKFLRTNLSDGLKKSYELNKLNILLLGIEEIKIFEIGTVFIKDKEETHIAWNEKDKIKEIKLEDFDASEEKFMKIVSSSDKFSGSRGKSPDAEILTNDFNDQVFKMWSAYPFITRDIAVWVPEETNVEILRNIYKEFGTELLIGEPRLIDTFTKTGRTSYAFRLIFQSYDRTLTIDEINMIMSNITEKLSNQGFEIR